MAKKTYTITKSCETPTHSFTTKAGKLTPTIVYLKGSNGKSVPKDKYTTKTEGGLFTVEFKKPMIFFIELTLS